MSTARQAITALGSGLDPRLRARVSGITSRHPRAGALVSGIDSSSRHPREAPAFAGVTGDPEARSARREAEGRRLFGVFGRTDGGVADAGSAPGMRCGRAGFGAGALRAALDARSLRARSATRPCGPQTRLAFCPHRPARLGPAQAPAHPQRTPGALGARQVSRQLHLKRACVLVAQARADVQVERSCSGKEPALNSVNGGLTLSASSPTILLFLRVQEEQDRWRRRRHRQAVFDARQRGLFA